MSVVLFNPISERLTTSQATILTLGGTSTFQINFSVQLMVLLILSICQWFYLIPYVIGWFSLYFFALSKFIFMCSSSLTIMLVITEALISYCICWYNRCCIYCLSSYHFQVCILLVAFDLVFALFLPSHMKLLVTSQIPFEVKTICFFCFPFSLNAVYGVQQLFYLFWQWLLWISWYISSTLAIINCISLCLGFDLLILCHCIFILIIRSIY